MGSLQEENNRKVPERYSKNADGDFYVAYDSCITCGAPQAEAPDLIDHSKEGYGHCFFKKQPETPEEIDKAIIALDVSCVGALRYGGKNESILNRLYALGLEHLCDYELAEIHTYDLQGKVTFKFSGSIDQLYDNLVKQISSPIPLLDKDIIDFFSNNKDEFEFIYRPAFGLTGIQFKCEFSSDGHCCIRLIKEKNAVLITVSKNAEVLDTILLNDENVKEIIWYNTKGEVYAADKAWKSL